MADPGAFAAQLQALRDAFSKDMSTRIAELEQAWADPGSPDDARLKQIHMLAHRLGGAAGTFGFTAVGEACRSLELKAQAATLIEGRLPPETRAELQGELERVRRATDGAPEVPIPAREGGAGDPKGEPPPSRDLFLLLPAGDPPDWATQLSFFGHSLRTFHTLEDLVGALKVDTPPLAIVDDELLPGPTAAQGPLATFQATRTRPVPLIFLSNWPDLNSRIQAVRSGARAYFSKPPDILGLVEAVDTFAHRVPAQPYRILIVDDDPLQAQHHQGILQGSGMKATLVHDPLKLMQPLVETQPDLVLMDLYMPGCTGVELASAIRQQEAFVGIPIVFLSQERARELQLEALRLGGDDFLEKPVDPDHLLSIVTARAQRGRVLRGLMVRDSLTGLLNHSAVLDRVAPELARAHRSGTPLAFAMLDLDHFKAVNDTHGHAAGDRVLRALARMLQQRLRKTDIVGRYGGEEFSVILPGADRGRAVEILEDVRQSFQALEFSFASGPLRATFSGGVADFPAHRDPEALIQAADEALYRAKREGRNRVVTA